MNYLNIKIKRQEFQEDFIYKIKTQLYAVYKKLIFKRVKEQRWEIRPGNASKNKSESLHSHHKIR